MKIKSIFPLSLFPTTVEIVGLYIIICYHQLVTTQQVDIPIKEISKIEVDSFLVFAQLNITWGYEEKIEMIENLWTKDAEKMKEAIENETISKNVLISNHD